MTAPFYPGFLLTPLSLIPPVSFPCCPCLVPSAPSHMPYLSHGTFSVPRKYVCHLTDQGWAEAWGSSSTPWNPSQPGACPRCPCHFVLLLLIHLRCPPPYPPAMAASAWEITDTESAASFSVLLTEDFLPLRAPWWDQAPSWSLGPWGEGRSGWRGRGEGLKVKERGRIER